MVREESSMSHPWEHSDCYSLEEQYLLLVLLVLSSCLSKILILELPIFILRFCTFGTLLVYNLQTKLAPKSTIYNKTTHPFVENQEFPNFWCNPSSLNDKLCPCHCSVSCFLEFSLQFRPKEGAQIVLYLLPPSSATLKEICSEKIIELVFIECRKKARKLAELFSGAFENGQHLKNLFVFQTKQLLTVQTVLWHN